MDKTKVIMHPIRIKILQHVLFNKQLTTKQLLEKIPDVPQATLYRHIKILLDENFLHVEEERQVRGTVEKVLSVKQNPNITKENLQNFTNEEHYNLFFTFMAQLLNQYQKYLELNDYDHVRDGVSFKKVSLYLSDDELKQFSDDIMGCILKVINNEPSGDRKARTLSTIILPDLIK